MIEKDDKVLAKATLFDEAGDGGWSKTIFGKSWNTAKCSGTYQGTVGRTLLIRTSIIPLVR